MVKFSGAPNLEEFKRLADSIIGELESNKAYKMICKWVF